ncbi:transporter substrate-binding domain-containing protein [Caenimonas terrae]|uniref:Transporter substrate-binding domain-containing protein n=1 Tax=Caenimonas terrae TaxID=696074 RepID=A0ABW0NDR5_9BURK
MSASLRRLLPCTLALAAALGCALPPAQATSLADIIRRGKLVVGVKKDVPLWGQLDPASGRIVGLEPDLAQLVAADLGVALELVGVLTAERVDAVTSGRVDMLIATLSDTPERRKQMDLVLPHYYSSGVNLLARKSENFRDWADLRNRRICGRRGAFYNRPVTVTYGADIVPLYSNEWANAALREGRCAALLYDDTAIAAMLQDPRWATDFAMPLKTIFSAPWAIALAPAERGGELEQRVSRLVASWHRSGKLRQLEQAWHIPQTKFLADMNSVWNRKEGSAWFCGDQATPRTPPECL